MTHRPLPPTSKTATVVGNQTNKRFMGNARMASSTPGSSIAEVAPGKVYALRNLLTLDGRVSAYPGAARGYSVSNCYLLVEPGGAAIEGDDRQARGHGFRNHVAEGVREAGEDEAVGVGEAGRKFLALLHAEEVDVGVPGLERFQLRAIADDDFRARQIGLDEGGDVLLDGDPAAARQLAADFLAFAEENAVYDRPCHPG